MNATIQKFSIIVIGVFVVLFLLLDGGAMAEATINSSLASNGVHIGQHWIWIIPTLLIFGLGFLLAWIVFGKNDAQRTARNAMSDKTIELSRQGDLRADGED